VAKVGDRTKDGETQYAWDTITQQEVHVGYKEDWPHEANENQNWAGTTSSSGRPKAEHGDASARYRCCSDQTCATRVLVSQAAINKWHFRRKDPGGGMPPTCKNRSHYVGESSFHWKTTLQIKKYLDHKKRTNTNWLDRRIVDVEREQGRYFPLGKSARMLRPDIFVRFEDGTWLVVEVVYTHAPEKENHEAYNYCKTLGPRIVELNLERHIEGTITDASHAKWVREGGMEKALVMEAELEQRQEQFDIRNRKFTRDEDLEINKMRKRIIAQCKNDFPHLSQLTIEEEDEPNLQWIENQFIRAHEIHNQIKLLTNEHGTNFGLNPDEMTSVDEVNTFFQTKAGERDNAEDRIKNFIEKYPHFTLPQELRKWAPIKTDFLTRFEEVEDYAERCAEAIETGVKKGRDEEMPPGSLNKIEAYSVDLEIREFSNFKARFEEYCKQVEDSLRKEQIRKHARELAEETGIVAPEGHLAQNIQWITEWYERAKPIKEICDAILQERMDAHELQGDERNTIEKRLKESVQPDYNIDFDENDYAERVENAMQGFNIDLKISELQQQTDIKMPPSVRDDMEVKDIQPWFDRAIEHKEKCESHLNQEIEKLSIENQQYPQFKKEKMRNVLIDYENMNYHTFVLNLQKAKRSVPRRGNTRNDPFNPFSEDAALHRQIRKEAQERSRRPRYTKVTPKARSSDDFKADFERKQAIAKENLSRAERLDAMRRKSEELKKEAKSNPSSKSVAEKEEVVSVMKIWEKVKKERQAIKEAKSNPSDNKSQSKKRKKAKPETAQEKKDRLKAKRDRRQAIKEVNERAANAEKEAKNAALSAKKGKKREYSRRTNLGPSRRRKGSGK
jgi:hypothetical protein